jgi:very-short-patch-repair endonuclease
MKHKPIQALPSQADYEREYERRFEGARLRRLHNPSPCDRALGELLDAMGLKATREYRLGASLHAIGFYLEEHRLAIEIETASARSREFRRGDEIKRKRALCGHLGIQLITVNPVNLDENPNFVAEAIEAAIEWPATAAAA